MWRTNSFWLLCTGTLWPPLPSLLLGELGKEGASCSSEGWLSDQGWLAISGHEPTRGQLKGTSWFFSKASPLGRDLESG